MSSRRKSLALRSVVYFHGQQVEDRVFPREEKSVSFGEKGSVVLPNPRNAEEFLSFLWCGDDLVMVRDSAGEHHKVVLGSALRVSRGDIDVELSLVPQYRLPRSALLGEGDLLLAVAILAMTVFALQVELVMSFFASPGPSEVRVQPTPELIARLLRSDLDGEESGALAERQQGATEGERNPSFYLPAGGEGPTEQLDGSWEEGQAPLDLARKPGGGESPAGLEVPSIEQGAPLASPSEPGEGDSLWVVEAEDKGTGEAPAEIGWGFQDWYETIDERTQEIYDEIQRTQALLKIDPEDSWALSHLGYYQYLADDSQACLATYERFVELYPDLAAGYNNLALVYKRLGDYLVEESFYLRALALDAEDTFVLNNLAVNLAHQKRFEEALAIMNELALSEAQDAYSDLHRSKIHAAMGQSEQAFAYLESALKGASELDTLHHIEFRQDIRVDPAFDPIRQERRFRSLLVRYYGTRAQSLLGGG